MNILRRLWRAVRGWFVKEPRIHTATTWEIYSSETPPLAGLLNDSPPALRSWSEVYNLKVSEIFERTGIDGLNVYTNSDIIRKLVYTGKLYEAMDILRFKIKVLNRTSPQEMDLFKALLEKFLDVQIKSGMCVESWEMLSRMIRTEMPIKNSVEE